MSPKWYSLVQFLQILLQEYYFVGEYIGVIHTMYLMEQNASTGLQTQEKYIQTMRFYLTLRRILDTDLECSSKYKILYYKGNIRIWYFS